MNPALLTPLLLSVGIQLTCGALLPTAKMDVLLTTEAILMVLNSSSEAIVQVRGTLLPATDHPGGRGTLLPATDHPGGRGTLLPATDHPGGRGTLLPATDHPGGRGTLLPATDHPGGGATRYDQLVHQLKDISEQQSASDDLIIPVENRTDVYHHSRKESIERSNQSNRFLHINSTTTSTTTTSTPPPPPPSTTRKHVYVRGHLLTRQRQRVFHPADTQPRVKDHKAPPNIHRTFIEDFRNEPGHQKRTSLDTGTSMNRAKKHSTGQKKEKFYNYKLLYDTIKNQSDSRHKETEFYAWIFGAAMLTLGSLTTLTACFVFCFCGEKWRKRRQRRRYDKSGEYQRVDSVSSIVDHGAGQLDPILEEQIDNVTII